MSDDESTQDSDDESTQEIDIDALRASIAATRGAGPRALDASSGDGGETSRATRPLLFDPAGAGLDERTVVGAEPLTVRTTDDRAAVGGAPRSSMTLTDIGAPSIDPATRPARDDLARTAEKDAIALADVEEVDDIEEIYDIEELDDIEEIEELHDVAELADLGDIEDVEDETDELDLTDARREAYDAEHGHDGARTLPEHDVGRDGARTLPEHDVAEALRAAMAEMPAPTRAPPTVYVEDGETQTELPPGADGALASSAATRPGGLPAGSRPAAMSERPPAVSGAADPEESELIAQRRHGALVALYRQRLTEAARPSAKAALLLKIASVYETGIVDPNEAFTTLASAFEIAPDDPDVIAAIDRVGKATQRIGELADHVRRKLLPGATDDKRPAYLGHLVYWYERVLGRGREVSSFVSELERHDGVHPVVLKRAAQLAAMNGDTKAQREHLARALERTVRKEERVTLLLALASAHAGTTEAVRYYEAALELDPTSLVALQGLKRIGKEKEDYAQVTWALERQAEVAPTESERVGALLELAEIEETKFLKHKLAAELFERVLAIEPSQPAALKGLERCYHALRDWPNLVRALALRAEQTLDKATKIELLELAAEVHESKLGDHAAAAELYRSVLVVDPKHRRALVDLARLYDRLGDLANFATYKARIAELAPTKRACSQELVKLGDFLDAPDRDPAAAKLQYERAVAVDPTNAVGWEALQRFAAAAGDDQRVIECLEQRKQHTDAPRQRAVVLVELAKAHRARGDGGAARACFEAASRADSSNEDAAVAMLDEYAAEERWAEAAPLCELLVNAAIRDRDGEALFVRLRLATRIAAALGDRERAMTSALAALDARPKDPGARRDLIAVAAQCRDVPAALEKARPRIAELLESGDDLPAEPLVGLARLQRDLGHLDDAAVTLERARALAPHDREILHDLAELYLAQADYPRACKLKVDLARSATSAELRFDLLCEAGEIWARRAGELEKAVTVFEEARALCPLDPWLLRTMAWLYGELGDFTLAAGALEDVARSDAGQEDKVGALVAMADIVERRLGDRLRAAELYDRVLDLDKTRLDAFESLVRTLTEDKSWERLERAYRRMIARIEGDGPSQLQFLLLHQVGLIYRDRLGDAARAYDVLEAAARLDPDDAEVRKILVELLVVTDNLDSAVARVREAIERSPHEPELYAELYDLYLRQTSFDKAWCTVNVLARLREPTPEQRRFHEDYAPMPLDRVPGQIVEQAWSSHVFHPDLDPALTRLFAALTPVVARMRYGLLRPEQRAGRPFTQAHSPLRDQLQTSFDDASEILGLRSPELLLGDRDATAPFTPAISSYGALLVCGPAVEALPGSLVYLAGKSLAGQRPELAARAFFPTVAELTILLAAAGRVSRNESAPDASGAALDVNLGAVLSQQERQVLWSAAREVSAAGADVDVRRWFVAADLSTTRAGLLLAGDVGPARDAILASASSAADMSPRDKVGELYKFATSDLYSELRGAIGVAVRS